MKQICDTGLITPAWGVPGALIDALLNEDTPPTDISTHTRTLTANTHSDYTLVPLKHYCTLTIGFNNSGLLRDVTHTFYDHVFLVCVTKTSVWHTATQLCLHIPVCCSARGRTSIDKLQPLLSKDTNKPNTQLSVKAQHR